ncbi:MAG: hypothetical protein RAP41_06555 [Candidatus Orphnella occulta]|nr:hypothetical protein [Candidatus Orphnella occulta]MDP8297824.1 hypothetical protein [Candidatus Orphnella occulta]
MNKVAISVLALALMLSVSGCISKSEHDAVLQAKVTADKKCAMLTQENKGLKSQTSILAQVKRQLTVLTDDNKRLNNEVSKLKKDKESLTRQLQQAKTQAKTVANEPAKAQAVSAPTTQ